MKHKLLFTMGLIVLGWAVFTAVQADAHPTSRYGYNSYMPSWNQTLPASLRFVVLTNMNNEAVWDRETGLVWEKAPSSESTTWLTAVSLCRNMSLGGRKGWRLATVEEYMSLIDPTNTNPALPSGHPFSNVDVNPFSYYWAANSWEENNAGAFLVEFAFGSGNVYAAKTGINKYWCVRGGQGLYH